MPRAAAAAMAGPSETLEFAGVNVMGTTTFINVFDKQTKKGRWISVGGTENGISVLAFDPLRDQVVVKSGDIQKTLTLRKATGVVNAPRPVTVMPAASGFAVASPAEITPNAAPLPAPSFPTPSADAPVAAAPAPVSARPEAPAKPTTVARQEEEARMLVSDLLEIGMAQRKAYEEAQKKAAAAQTEQASQPAPAATPPGT